MEDPPRHQAPVCECQFYSHQPCGFNIKGNDYRVVVAVAYSVAATYIKFVGTRAKYVAIDACTVENLP